MNSIRDSKKPSVMKPWLKYYDQDPITEELQKKTLYDYLFQGNKDHLCDIALNYFDNEITFGKLFENIQKTAGAYLALGVKAGDIITVCSVTTPEIIYTFYAASLIGASLNMVDPRTSVDGIRGYITEVKSKCICVLNKAYPKLHDAIGGSDTCRIVVVSPYDSLSHMKRMAYHLKNNDINKYSQECIKWEHFIAQGEKYIEKPVPYTPEHCAVIMHTGGTTGSPKGVMLSDDAFNALVSQYSIPQAGFKRQQKFLNVMPPFIAYGFACGIHLPLSLGITTILIPNFKPRNLPSLFIKYKPAYMCGVPIHYQILANDKRMKHADISYLINGGSGGDAITIGAENEVNNFFKAHGCKFPLAKGYGMTELCSSVCSCMGNINKLGSVGIPLILNTVSAFEYGTDKELNFGEKGEICITGPTIMLGYYNNTKETANVLRKHSDGKIWVHTGDIGYVDEDGFVFIDARIKRMIIRHDGFKVFPSMIENVVSTHPAVKTCSAVSSRDKHQIQGNLPYVYIVLKKNVQKSQKQIRAEIIKLCQEKLPEYAQPTAYKFCDTLYYTPIGKVDYRKLEKEAG